MRSFSLHYTGASGDGLALHQPKVEVLLSTIHPPPRCCSVAGGLVISKDPDFRGSVAVCGEENSHSVIMQIASRKTKVHM